MTGDKILGLLIIMTISIHLAGIYALCHPHSLFAWIFFRRKFGPNTQINQMTKKELMQSGVRFFLLSLYPFLTMVGLGAFGKQLKSLLSDGIILSIGFACSIFFGACVIGGTYLIIRGLIRCGSYVPEPVDPD
jgi:hypothetical protein